MYTEEIFYGIRCDRCHEQYESDEYSYMSGRSEILEAAENDDWREIDGRHYCPDCYVKDPEPADDDHEYMPKTPYPDCVYKVRRIVAELLGYGMGSMVEKDDCLHLRFPLNKDLFDDVLQGAIKKKMDGREYTVGTEDVLSEFCGKNHIRRFLHIAIPFQSILKGDRVRVIKHIMYKDCFGKEGKVLEIRNQRIFVVRIFDDEIPEPRYLTVDYLERIDEGKDKED